MSDCGARQRRGGDQESRNDELAVQAHVQFSSSFGLIRPEGQPGGPDTDSTPVLLPGSCSVAVKADTLSLTAFEVCMFAWMAVTYFILFAAHPPEASSIVFWFMMQIGMLLGFATTCPADWLLVKLGVKMGM